MTIVGRNILIVAFLFQVIQIEAQNINWDNINLTGREAKVLASTRSGSEKKYLLITKIFETKEGKITVYLPPLSSSANISGTVYLEPSGRDSSRNLAVLQTNHLNLGDFSIPVQRGSFQIKLPTDLNAGTILLLLKSSTGQLIKSEQLPVTTSMLTNNGLTIPSYIVSGDASAITGSFDGNMTNTSVNIHGEKVELFAESSSHLYFTSTGSQPGKTSVKIYENGTAQTSTSNILKLDLTADNTNLRRGQQTQLHISISGLEGLEEKVPVTIQNTSSSVIKLDGGDIQQITIDPRNDAPSGVLNISRSIQSLKNGGFSISVNITPFSAPMRR